MSFFQKAKPRKAPKRKFEAKSKKSKQSKPSQPNDDDDDESVDSELETRDFPDRSDSEGELETAQEKKLRLARLYLSEIEREELARNGEQDDRQVGARLRDDLLLQQGRLRSAKAAQLETPTPLDIRTLRGKDLRLPVTCMCITTDGLNLYSGTKCSSIIHWDLTEMKKVNSVLFKKGTNKKNSKFECHSTPIAALAVSSDSKYLVSCENSNDIQVWDAASLKHLHTFRGHRDHVTDLVFRKDSNQLFSASKDRSVKVWSVDEMAYIETVFGHQSGITSIDALTRERAITAGGRDNSIRIWKIVEESQLIFNGHSGSIDCVRLINEENFISCSDDGSICVWGNMKKKPLCAINKAHGTQDGQVRWITCVAALLNSDLVASGSHDGFVRLWKLKDGFRSIVPLMEIPVAGFINSIIFSSDGSKLIVGVGQEHKLARWWRVKEAKNAVYVIPLTYKITTS